MTGSELLHRFDSFQGIGGFDRKPKIGFNVGAAPARFKGTRPGGACRARGHRMFTAAAYNLRVCTDDAPAPTDMTTFDRVNARPLPPLPRLIFASRWLQLPLYVGLILAQAVYVYHFWVELSHLIGAAFGDGGSVAGLINSVGYKGESNGAALRLNETIIMLVVLGLIDVVMISNLLIMVIVGGYETFVSRMNLEGHPDQPEWLSHVNASVLKVKLATAIIGISSIHLLKTFINAANYDVKTLVAQTGIHLTFLVSAMAIAACDRLMLSPQQVGHGGKH
jgi:uncharacterized protein (TIGR00645 family)